MSCSLWWQRLMKLYSTPKGNLSLTPTPVLKIHVEEQGVGDNGQESCASYYSFAPMRFAHQNSEINFKKWLLIAITPIGLSLVLSGLSARNSVKPAISNSYQAELELQRISLLEKHLTPQTAQETVLTWAKGVQTRNGALQFALLSPELQTKMKADYLAMNWVTGVSSPWVESYKITRKIQQDEGWEFEIEYQMMTSTGSAGTETERIQVAKLKGDCEPLSSKANRTSLEGWYITQLSSSAKVIRFIRKN